MRAVIEALRPGFAFLVALLILFQLFRLILIGASWSLRGDATLPLILEALLVGTRFDLSMAAKIAAPMALWWAWRPTFTTLERRIACGLIGLVALGCIFSLTVEVEFYKEFQMRLGPLAFEYFGKPEHNRIVLGMIWDGYPVVRWLAVCFIVWAAFVWVARRLLDLRHGEPLRWRASAAATIVISAIAIVLHRGGFQSSVLRWGDAYFSQSTYANHMAENGVFALMDTLRDLAQSDRTHSRSWLPGSREPAIAAVRSAILLPGEQLVAADRYPLLRRSPPSAIAKRRPRNVVVVIMESFTARFCGAVGARFGATPCFDALAQGGVLFDRAFSVGTHTAQGVYAVLCSYPNLPGCEALMKHTLGNQPFRSLPAILGEQGYQTLFLYNGLASWDNKEGFFRSHGMQRFVELRDFSNPIFLDPDWGVSDQDVFRRANQEFTALAATAQPFLGVILTLSNHAPFNLPQVPGLAPITTGGEQNTRLNGVHYADWALGQFMEEARAQPWFGDTLFAFVGDHGFGIPPELTEANLLHMHVPLLFYGPEILAAHGEVRHVVASQLDILPTLLGVVGRDVVHQSFGRDLFALPADDPGHAFVKRAGDPNVGWIAGNEILITSLTRPASFYTFDLSFPPSAAPITAPETIGRRQQREQLLRAFVWTGLNTLEQHLAAPR
ncbi:MAG: LTA synthase family protein [Planctomycetota bacterium]